MQGLKLLILLGLPVVLVALLTLNRPFNWVSRVAILLSPYRQLLPYIVAQARHESNDFKSNILKTHNNFFGMKNAGKRDQLGVRGDAAPDGGYYQRYPIRLYSVLDYLRYLKAVNFPLAVGSSDEFVTRLYNKNYFGKGPTALVTYLNGVNHFLS